MTKSERNPKDKARNPVRNSVSFFVIRISTFFRHSSFVISNFGFPASAGRRRAEMRRVRGVGCGVVQHGIDGRRQGRRGGQARKHGAITDAVFEKERRAL